MALTPVPPVARPLVDILVDMVKSALAWEEDHGRTGIPEQSTSGDGLPIPASRNGQRQMTFEDLRGLRATGYVRDVGINAACVHSRYRLHK